MAINNRLSWFIRMPLINETLFLCINDSMQWRDESFRVPGEHMKGRVPK